MLPPYLPNLLTVSTGIYLNRVGGDERTMTERPKMEEESEEKMACLQGSPSDNADENVNRQRGKKNFVEDGAKPMGGEKRIEKEKTHV